MGWLAYRQLVPAPADQSPVRHVDGGASDAERAAARELLDDAYRVLRSETFRRNLLVLERSYPDVYASRAAGEIPLRQIAALVASDAWGSRYAPLQVDLVGGDAPDDPERELAAAGGYLDAGVYAGMTLGRAHLVQYRSEDPVERSCAVNVAAHELAHTISTTPFFFTNAFTDTRPSEAAIPGRENATTPVGSYFIGAVAQCTWLEERGRIPPGGIQPCLQVFGVRQMNWRRCGSFADGRPVALTADLPAPMTPL